MKQKDVLLIVVVVIISGVISIIVSNMLFSTTNSAKKVEVVEPITADFQIPDSKFFNKDSINPTQLIKIGEDPNKAPFKKADN